MTEPLDRLQLHASLDALVTTQGADPDARLTVFQYGASLPNLSRIRGSGSIRSSGNSFTGHTSEHGNVKVEDEKPETKTYDFGGEWQRVGMYKVSRDQFENAFQVIIGHFWKFDQGTESETESPQVWALCCDQDGPIWFGELGCRVLWDRWGLTIQKAFYVEQWGEKIGRRHPAGLQVNFSIRRE